MDQHLEFNQYKVIIELAFKNNDRDKHAEAISIFRRNAILFHDADGNYYKALDKTIENVVDSTDKFQHKAAMGLLMALVGQNWQKTMQEILLFMEAGEEI